MLNEAGFEIVRGVLGEDECAALGAIAAALDAARTPDEQRAHRVLGSLISTRAHAALDALSSQPRALAALEQRGLAPHFATGGYLFRKPPGGSATYWHQDWCFWDDPVSSAPLPPQVGVLFYLDATDPKTGCLRVIPGSAHRRHRAHDVWLHTDKPRARSGADANPALFEDHPEAVDVPVCRGDAILLDARTLHASRPHQGPAPRALITHWFLVQPARLLPQTRAAFGLAAGVAAPMSERGPR